METYTSTSEKNVNYPKITEEASSIDDIFQNFKQNKDYNEILEHVSQEQGAKYLSHINDDLRTKMETFKINDQLGNPKKYSYPPYGEISPTTLRYVKVLQDLKNKFVLEGSNIVEIGCGYGGQYTVLRQIHRPKKYTFVDLPTVLPLIKRYVEELGISSNTELINGKDENVKYDDKYDLIISNYAISECNKEVQDFYLENILRKSEHGYITHNQFNGYVLDEFVNRLKNYGKAVNVSQETPITGRKNVIVTW